MELLPKADSDPFPEGQPKPDNSQATKSFAARQVLSWTLVVAPTVVAIIYGVMFFHLLPLILLSPLSIAAAYFIYKSATDRLKAKTEEVEAISNLHFATAEALATAIDAKDQTTHCHVRRVQIYAARMGEVFDLSKSEIAALKAGALLHDIGKLAVPEHIISKPGRLTPEEFEKMKIHPVVGAEILERVRFPYPVVPIVRAHHEKWDGSGYPFGLKEREIPIGARILSAVDFMDAMASDRQYRRALPIDEVMKRLLAESGKSFDPNVVNVLHRRYRQLENFAVRYRHFPGWLFHGGSVQLLG